MCKLKPIGESGPEIPLPDVQGKAGVNSVDCYQEKRGDPSRCLGKCSVTGTFPKSNRIWGRRWNVPKKLYGRRKGLQLGEKKKKKKKTKKKKNQNPPTNPRHQKKNPTFFGIQRQAGLHLRAGKESSSRKISVELAPNETGGNQHIVVRSAETTHWKIERDRIQNANETDSKIGRANRGRSVTGAQRMHINPHSKTFVGKGTEKNG